MNKIVYLFITLFIVSAPAFSQKLISYEEVNQISAESLNDEYGLDSEYDQKVYKVLYYTKHIDRAQDTASGLVCIPIANEAFPTLVYNHGTVSTREEVPSRENGSEIGNLFSALGYISVMPDFIGLGDSKGLHPYIHADSEAWAGADLLVATEEMISELGIQSNGQLFLTGYSQGGHASAALHRDIEAGKFEELSEVTAASHLSGPYSVSDAMMQFTLGDEDYFTLAYLPWVVLSVEFTNPELANEYSPENIFKPEFLNDIYEFRDEKISLITLNFRLVIKLNALYGNTYPKNMFQPEIVESLLTDPEHPLTKAIAENDVYDWTPKCPTRLMGCAGDDQVTYQNAIIAEETMIANGAQDVMAEEYGENLDHGGCVQPVVRATIEFFEQYKMTQTVATQDISEKDCVSVLNNRYNQYLTSNCSKIKEFTLYDMNGQVMTTVNVDSHQNITDISSFTTGLYITRIILENGDIHTEKIMIK